MWISFTSLLVSLTFAEFTVLVPQLYVGAILSPPQYAWLRPALSLAEKPYFLALAGDQVPTCTFVHDVWRNCWKEHTIVSVVNFVLSC